MSAVFVYLAIVDPTLSATVSGYSKFGPAALGVALSGGVAAGNGPYGKELLPALAAGGVYLAATAILVAAGGIATRHRDLL